MPASPSFVHSHGTPRTFRIRDAHGNVREVEERNGCLVDPQTHETICGSDKAASYLLKHGLLSEHERIFVREWAMSAFRSASVQAGGVKLMTTGHSSHDWKAASK